tara:strand:+ start:268 stop:603 length:336 start_codon:yes stop_codon:yes gene_type:complete
MVLILVKITFVCIKSFVMLFTPFQWSVLVFAFGQTVAIIKFCVWVVTRIELLNSSLQENSKRDLENKEEIQGVKKDVRSIEEKIYMKLDLIIQGLVRVEEKVKHLEKQSEK